MKGVLSEFAPEKKANDKMMNKEKEACKDVKSKKTCQKLKMKNEGKGCKKKSTKQHCKMTCGLCDEGKSFSYTSLIGCPICLL